MLNDLNKTTGSDRLVTITTFSSLPTGQSRFLAPIAPLPTSNGGIAKATMNALADAVARLGGTHNAFNLTALAQGAPAHRWAHLCAGRLGGCGRGSWHRVRLRPARCVG